jgi:hypothetical protein
MEISRLFTASKISMTGDIDTGGKWVAGVDGTGDQQY